jgi:hypothetical protein
VAGAVTLVAVRAAELNGDAAIAGGGEDQEAMVLLSLWSSLRSSVKACVTPTRRSVMKLARSASKGRSRARPRVSSFNAAACDSLWPMTLGWWAAMISPWR